MRRIETQEVFESSVYFFMSNWSFKLRVIAEQAIPCAFCMNMEVDLCHFNYILFLTL